MLNLLVESKPVKMGRGSSKLTACARGNNNNNDATYTRYSFLPSDVTELQELLNPSIAEADQLEGEKGPQGTEAPPASETVEAQAAQAAQAAQGSQEVQAEISQRQAEEEQREEEERQHEDNEEEEPVRRQEVRKRPPIPSVLLDREKLAKLMHPGLYIILFKRQLAIKDVSS